MTILCSLYFYDLFWSFIFEYQINLGVFLIQCGYRFHTARCNTIFVQIYMDAPPGVPWVSKNHIFFSQMKLFSFCAKIALKM